MRSLCIIAYADFLSDGRIIRLADSASRAGYSVDVITPRKKKEPSNETVNHVDVFRLSVQQYSGRSNFLYIISYLEFFLMSFLKVTVMNFSRRYTVIQVCNIPDFLVFTTCMARLFGAKILLDIHDPMPRTYGAKFEGKKTAFMYHVLLLLEKLSAAYADMVMTVHEPVKRDILVKDGVKSEKITVIANFPDSEIFSVVDNYQVQRPIRMIYHGTIAARFGLGRLLEIFSDADLKEHFFLKIIGEGEYEGHLKLLIRDLGLEKSVDFENRVYPISQLPDILRHYHLGLAPYEPSPATDYMLPVKMMELLAMGIPTITIANVAIRYYLDEDMYFAYDPANMMTLKNILSKIRDNPALILEKREAIMRNRENCRWSAERQRYINLLEQLSR
jgi:glycosyltransferase involved in cell wall biosynthesis